MFFMNRIKIYYTKTEKNWGLVFFSLNAYGSLDTYPTFFEDLFKNYVEVT